MGTLVRDVLVEIECEVKSSDMLLCEYDSVYDGGGRLLAAKEKDQVFSRHDRALIPASPQCRYRHAACRTSIMMTVKYKEVRRN